MICELVRRGKKIGVTALSHKVIRNLLDAVVKAAAKNDVAGVRCMHRETDGEESDGVAESDSRRRNLRSTRAVEYEPAGEVDSPGAVCYTPRPLQPRGTRRDGNKVLDAQQFAAVGSAPLAGVFETAGGKVVGSAEWEGRAWSVSENWIASPRRRIAELAML